MSEEAGGLFKAPALPPSFAKPAPKVVEQKQEKPAKAPTDPPVASKPAPVEDGEKQETQVKKDAVAAKPVPDAPPLNYSPPEWACVPPEGLSYKLEILKNGAIVETIDLEKRENSSFVVIGRLPICDVVMDHPSISRYHCILQYGEDKMAKKNSKGWFIYDMGSTHGSKMNKNRLPPKQHLRVQVGFVFQFGGSSRIMSLLGPADDAEPEWDCSPTEMREKMHKKALEKKLAAAAKKEFERDQKEEKDQEDGGCNWGMDYGEGDGDTPMFDLEGHLAEDGEAYYSADPKKALTKFFERVGFEMKFDYSESGQGHTHKWICSIELPVEVDGVDRSMTAQATVSTNKKDAAVQCALEACKILDRYNVLRGTNARTRMKKKTLEDNDFYDEDDDLYFDRTGQLEAQREKRRVWALKSSGKYKEEKDTYESLTAKLKATREEMDEVNKELDQLGHKGMKSSGSAADLDDYMNKLAKGTIAVKDDMDTKMHKSTLRQRLVALTHEAQTLEKLVKIAKPVALPTLTGPGGSGAASASKQAFLRKLNQYGNVRKELAAATGVEKSVEEEKKEDKEADDSFKGPSLPPPAKKEVPVAVVNPLAKAPPKVSEPEVATLAVETKALEEKVPTDPVVAEPAPSDVPEPTTSTVKEPEPEEIVQEEPPKAAVEKEERTKEEVEPENVPEERKRAAETVEEGEKAVPKKRKPRVRKEKPLEEYGASSEHKDELYATWMPPENQSGDGKTSLHDKFAGRY